MPRKPETKLMNAILDPEPWFEDADLHETVEGQTLGDTLNQLIDKLAQSNVAIPTFASRFKRIIRLRFGFDSPDGQGLTLRQLGTEVGVTAERIRQIETRALRRLRHPTYRNTLRCFIKERR